MQFFVLVVLLLAGNGLSEALFGFGQSESSKPGKNEVATTKKPVEDQVKAPTAAETSAAASPEHQAPQMEKRSLNPYFYRPILRRPYKAPFSMFRPYDSTFFNLMRKRSADSAPKNNLDRSPKEFENYIANVIQGLKLNPSMFSKFKQKRLEKKSYENENENERNEAFYQGMDEFYKNLYKKYLNEDIEDYDFGEDSDSESNNDYGFEKRGWWATPGKPQPLKKNWRASYVDKLMHGGASNQHFHKKPFTYKG